MFYLSLSVVVSFTSWIIVLFNCVISSLCCLSMAYFFSRIFSRRNNMAYRSLFKSFLYYICFWNNLSFSSRSEMISWPIGPISARLNLLSFEFLRIFIRAIALISASSKIWSISDVILGSDVNLLFFIFGDRLLFKEALVALRAFRLFLEFVLLMLTFFMADIDIFFFFFSFYSVLSLADNFDSIWLKRHESTGKFTSDVWIY